MILLNNALIMTMNKNIQYENGFVLMDSDEQSDSNITIRMEFEDARFGIILAVGAGDGLKEMMDWCLLKKKDTSNFTIINAHGGVVMPGFIDPHCHIGLWEDGQSDEDGDGNEESDPCTPHMRAIDAINPFDPCFREAVEGGITSVMTGPGSANVIGGQFAFLKTCGINIEKMIVKAPAAMKVAFGENPKSVYGKKNTAPGTRMGTAAILREAFFKAMRYRDDLEKAKTDPKKDVPDFDIKSESLIPVIEGRLPLKIHAHRADDMLTAIRICNEFNLRFTLDHCTEGYRIAKDIYEEQLTGRLIGVIAGPLISERCKPELAHLSIQNPSILSKQGICTGIMTDHPVLPVQYLPVSVAIATREGMDENKALEAITINAAKLCGVETRVGSLEVGKDADLVVMSGHPFEFRTKILYTIINGKLEYTSSDTTI